MHSISVLNVNEKFDCKEDVSLLSGMEEQSKKAINVGCRGGGCGFCKIKILSGAYEAKKMSIRYVTKEERDQGYALACRIFPRSAMQVLATPSEF